MGIWVELGVFVLALAFGLWQIHDVKQAQAATRRQRALESRGSDQAKAQGASPDGALQGGDPQGPAQPDPSGAGEPGTGLSERRR